MDDFYSLNFNKIWTHFKKEHISFWMICFYLIFEYVRPQSIIPFIDVLPWAQVFIILSGVTWVMDKNKNWVRNPTNKWMVAFLFVIILSSTQAYWPSISYSHLADFYTWLVIYFLIINIITTEKRLFIFLLIFCLASFKLSLFGARTWAFRGFQFTSWGLMGPPGYFQNSGELAIQMLMFSGVSWYFYKFIKPYLDGPKLWCVSVFPITAAMTVMGSSSRGGQLGLFVQIYQIFIKGNITFKATVSIILLALVLYWALPEEQLDRFISIGVDKTSEQRLLYWENGWEMMTGHPWMGVGYFNFPAYFESYYSPDMLYDRAQLPHNIFIQVGTDTGFIGLSIYIILIVQLFKSGRLIRKLGRSKPDSFLCHISLGLEIGFWGFLVAGQFVSVAYYPFMWIQLALMICVRNIMERQVHFSDSSGRV